MAYVISLRRTVRITLQDIEDIMVCALEGGITYWCDRAEPEGGLEQMKGDFLSEHIALGGAALLHDMEEDKEYRLDAADVVRGVKTAIEQGFTDNDIFTDERWDRTSDIDACCIDAELADVIVQLAIFGEIVYG